MGSFTGLMCNSMCFEDFFFLGGGHALCILLVVIILRSIIIKYLIRLVPDKNKKEQKVEKNKLQRVTT